MHESCPRTAAALAAVERENDGPREGVGFLPLLMAAAPIAAAALGPKAPKGPDYNKIAEIEARTAARELAAEQATGRFEAAGSTRSKILKFALIGGGVLLALGAIGLWAYTRKKNPHGGTRRRRRRRR